jgi:hypothetical protein
MMKRAQLSLQTQTSERLSKDYGVSILALFYLACHLKQIITRAVGWEVLHTYKGAVGSEYLKSVVTPMREVASKERMHGFWNKYGAIHADVFHIAGEIHENRKPVCNPSPPFGVI